MGLLAFSPSTGKLYRDGKAFDPWRLAWTPAEVPDDTASMEPLGAISACFALGRGRGIPVGVIGPREPSELQYRTAEKLGYRIGELGLTLLCGGKTGVMEAACKGCGEAGGRAIGLLPDEEWDAANDFVAVPLASGIGPARNAIIARASHVLIAVGGGHGTISEMAFGLQFKRLVLGLAGAPDVPGAIHCASVDEALERAACHFLQIDPPAGR